LIGCEFATLGGGESGFDLAELPRVERDKLLDRAGDEPVAGAVGLRGGAFSVALSRRTVKGAGMGGGVSWCMVRSGSHVFYMNRSRASSHYCQAC
jgi:hypothetical protein